MTKYSFQYRIDPNLIPVLDRFTSEVPVRVGALAQELGLKVSVAALPLNISGSIQPDPDGQGYIIKVNRFESKERQRFTIAHEIAHFLLHRDFIKSGVVDSILYRSKLSSRAEAEANRLAADIVMPSQQVREALSTLSLSTDSQGISSLADHFQVSKQAMAIRTG